MVMSCQPLMLKWAKRDQQQARPLLNPSSKKTSKQLWHLSEELLASAIAHADVSVQL